MFKGIIGQDRAKRAILDWYKYETQPLLIYGSSGYGKTMFAESLGAKTVDTTQMRGDRLNSMLKPIKESEDGDILFFDEIHSLQPKVLEGLYKIIDKGTFYDTDLCMDLELPKTRFVFATNILSPLPEAFVNRCKFVELQNYTNEELKKIVSIICPSLNKNALESIVRSSKGTPRVAISLAKSMLAAAKTEKLTTIGEAEVNSLLDSRFAINGATGLSDKEFLIMQRVAERGKLSSTAVANILRLFTTRRQDIIYRAIKSQPMVSSFKSRCNYGSKRTRKLQIIYEKERREII